MDQVRAGFTVDGKQTNERSTPAAPPVPIKAAGLYDDNQATLPMEYAAGEEIYDGGMDQVRAGFTVDGKAATAAAPLPPRPPQKQSALPPRPPQKQTALPPRPPPKQTALPMEFEAGEELYEVGMDQVKPGFNVDATDAPPPVPSKQGYNV